MSITSNDKNLVWSYTEEFPRESEVAGQARDAAAVLGVHPISTQTASMLTVLAATSRAQNTLEIGTGTGVSTLALLAGMQPGSALTTVDIDSSREQKAKEIVSGSHVGKSHRVRTITGDALHVLPRLSKGSYDFVFIDIDVDCTEFCAYQSLALLRSGGLLAINNPLDDGAAANPAQRGEDAVAMRRMLRDIQDCTDEVFVSLLHSEQGLYLVYKR